MKKIKGTYLLLIAVLGVAVILAGCSTDLGPGPDGGPLAVDLGTASGFAVLAKAGISTISPSVITGDIGVSPAAATFITGFSLTPATTSSTSPQVTGNVYAADYDPPTPTMMTTAVSDMETAFTDAAGRAPDATGLGAGDISGLVIEPGVYKWGTGLLLSTQVTLWGSDTATWIFQIAGGLTVESGAQVILDGGALAENVVWQVGSAASLGTTSHFEGTLLTLASITMATDAVLNGRAMAQTAVTLQSNTITLP